MKVRLINKSGNKLEYQSEGAAGVDISANKSKLLGTGEVGLVPTGIYLEIPNGYEAQVRPRSGLALKKGLTVLNSPGTIDSDYRGEVGVILINHSNETVSIEKGDRIAQLVFKKVEQVEFDNVSQLSSSDRGKGGFGSTGK